MDPCPFVRLIVESLALKLPSVSKPAGPGVHPSTNPCFCTISFPECPSSSRYAPLPLASDEACLDAVSPRVVFSLDPAAVQRMEGKPALLTVSVHVGRKAGRTCGMGRGRALGRVSVEVEVGTEAAGVARRGWVALGSSGALLHVVVRTEPEPRFVFQFGGEPECSPVVFQVHGGGSLNGGQQGGCFRQPVFSCRFSNDRHWNTRSRSLPNDSSNGIKTWFSSLGSFRGDKEQQRRDQRKGWMVTIHDLSGSPVAAASMVTPFVPSPGSDRVSRSNPGAWLILQPATGFSATSWKPWGRLEAWRERGPVDALGYKIELITDTGAITVAESSLSVRKGGQLCIDSSSIEDGGTRPWPFNEGFVMASTVEGERKVSRPKVQVGVRNVSCMTDVALFIVLAAAVDLSMDACQLFSHKLRSELCLHS
ncbi:hypothetical protein J5N97_004744 [Dioscorea zingiberensis]|uniref:DUF1005 family protein n=1 Tax=Dioscorea zingiberensis TaxID=325984 RepID=A0A9D5HRK0_9LILI|nr:hypothetical protein J5N97_004713 [Dioscorea zingiberensis]KAJ0986388.1 hypothetical protein J5N97_004744 [Dioscorea zingiberensis]